MSRARTLTTEEERCRFEAFLLAHSGHARRARQCERHPSLSRMTYPQLVKVMQEELGFAPTRMSVAKVCRELGIPRRHRPGPSLSDEEKRQRSAGRYQRWHDKTRKDPVAWEAYLKRKRVAGKKARARLRLDQPAWEAFLKQRAEYLRNYRRRQREAAAVA